MADVIRKAVNKFTKGLVMDFSPENTQSEVLTHALNATLLTFNGNEMSLQNDMGNARVETAYLPEGYIPVGTCEYGGIIYIVSYNPLEDKSQIGCFPSPERNVSNKELGEANVCISNSDFQNADGSLVNTSKYVLLKNGKLNPGDKFLVCSDETIYDEKLEGLLQWDNETKKYEPIENPILALNIVSIEDSGKIVYLNSDVLRYNVTHNSSTYNYHILGTMQNNKQESVDIDSYRNTLSSGYSVFKSKTSGKLALLAELVMIDSYSVTHSVEAKSEDSKNSTGCSFDVIIHTDIEPAVSETNYTTVPKLQYYFLQNSQGYLQIFDINGNSQIKPLFNINGNSISYNSDFYNTKLSDIYTLTTDDSFDLSASLGASGRFGFPRANTYHGLMGTYSGSVSELEKNQVYTKFTENKYHRVNQSQIINNVDYFCGNLQGRFYKYDPNNADYKEVVSGETITNEKTYYTKQVKFVYFDIQGNTAYMNEPQLYKLSSNPRIATDAEIADTSVPKYVYEYSKVYRPRTDKDTGDIYERFDNGGEIIFKKITANEMKENVVYYVSDNVEVLKRIGSVISTNEQRILYIIPDSLEYVLATSEERDAYWNNSSKPFSLYLRSEESSYSEATIEQIVNHEKLGITLYYKSDYTIVYEDNLKYESGTLFLSVPMDSYVSWEYFKPNSTYNYIQGKNTLEAYPNEVPISLHTVSDFVVDKETNYEYRDVKLASIQIPPTIIVNKFADLPFKYDYTLIPCMNYGKLDHLAVSNTVDFSKLHAFNQSDFNTWKYHIDGNQLRLTFGTDVYDTFETDKVDAIVLEFYDLYGFAGSLEITNKKSYSGIFTKIIPLNTLNALSKKRVLNNDYSENFKRNIGIIKTENGFTFNDNAVNYINPKEGWSINDADNDCGVLYSNIIYGVKTYLRKTKSDGTKEFFPKTEFFLYTIPIYNDYYYTVNNFNVLEYPKLDMVLTYKLVDSSSKTTYNNSDIVNGYCPTDSDLMKEYTGGFSTKDSMSVIKYYKYSGISDLYLEVGLNKDYTALNIAHSDEINKYFSCQLSLISEDNKDSTFTVLSDNNSSQIPEQLLQYKNVDDVVLELNINKLGFGGDYKSQLGVTSSDFARANFITSEGNDPIKIHYSFVVGYKAIISNISVTEVPVTTICALYHRNPSGEYNYNDFSIYTVEEENGGDYTTKYYSDAMYYNTGTSDTEIFGLCRQLNSLTSDVNMLGQCEIYSTVESDASSKTSAGLLNTGTPLKQVVPYIGKLTFCMPHAHAVSDTYGVNVHEQTDGTGGIPPKEGTWPVYDQNDDVEACFGISPSHWLYNNPRYNMVMNTKASMLGYSEFISTLEYQHRTGRAYGGNVGGDHEQHWVYNLNIREYVGFSGSQLELFNKRMLKTMSSVYAYNPDYDSLQINVGDIKIEDFQPKFTSTLLSRNAKFDFGDLSLNDFIYLGTIKISDYLSLLHKYSENEEGTRINMYYQDKPDARIEFAPNYLHCGDSENYYLISSLTYNTPIPTDLEDELSFRNNDMVVVKHSDGSNTFIQGTPDKRTLYGFKDNQLIQLDVSNYSIEPDGSLSFNTGFSEISEVTKSLDASIISQIRNTSGSTFDTSFTNARGKTDRLSIKVKLETSNATYLSRDGSSLFFGRKHPANSGTYSDFKLTCSIPSVGNSYKEFTYNISLNSFNVHCSGRILKSDLFSIGPGNKYNLLNIQPAQLRKLISGDQSCQLSNESPKDPAINYWKYSDKNSSGHNIIINYGYPHTQAEEVSTPSTFILTASQMDDIEVWQVDLKSITYTLEQLAFFEYIKDPIVHTTPTKKYASITGHKYVVDASYRKARLIGSSITLNDLAYEPNREGHRLFMKKGITSHDPIYRGRLYYRKFHSSGVGSSWIWNNTKNLNNLYIYTGPCYTPNYLS